MSCHVVPSTEVPRLVSLQPFHTRDERQLIGLRIGQGLEQDGVHHAEDGGVDADGQPEGQDGGHGERGALP